MFRWYRSDLLLTHDRAASCEVTDNLNNNARRNKMIKALISVAMEFSSSKYVTITVYHGPIDYSLNVKRVKKRVNANSLEKEWKPLKNSCYPLEKERNEKKSEIFHSKKSEKSVRVNTSEHHSKMYCPLFNSLKNGHSLAESERHSFSSEYSTILLVLLTIHSKRSEVHSQRVNVHSLKI